MGENRNNNFLWNAILVCHLSVSDKIKRNLREPQEIHNHYSQPLRVKAVQWDHSIQGNKA